MEDDMELPPDAENNILGVPTGANEFFSHFQGLEHFTPYYSAETRKIYLELDAEIVEGEEEVNVSGYLFADVEAVKYNRITKRAVREQVRKETKNNTYLKIVSEIAPKRLMEKIFSDKKRQESPEKNQQSQTEEFRITDQEQDQLLRDIDRGIDDSTDA